MCMSSPKWGGILHTTLTRVNYPELEDGVIAVSHNSHNDSLASSTWFREGLASIRAMAYEWRRQVVVAPS